MKALLAMIVCVWIASAATYFVSPSGSDSQDGSSEAPFLTLSHAVAIVVPGDTIVLKDGTYGAERSRSFPVVLRKHGSPNAWYTIRAEHKGRAILDCQNTGGWSQADANGCSGYISAPNASYWRIIGVVITRAFEVGIEIGRASNNIVIQDCEFREIGQNGSSISTGFQGIYVNKADSITIDRCYFHDIGRPPGYSGDHGVYTNGTNSKIINSIFHRPIPGYELQIAPGFSGVVENNTFAFPSGSGNYGEIVLWGALGEVTIRNNIFYNPIHSAIHNERATLTSCTIDHNIIYGVNSMLTEPGACTVTATIVADPKFANAATLPYDFRLTPGSPAIDGGTTGLGLQYDFNGDSRPAGHAPDIGALEYQGAAWRSHEPSLSLPRERTRRRFDAQKD